MVEPINHKQAGASRRFLETHCSGGGCLATGGSPVESKEWGFADGYKVYLITLTGKSGASLSLTNYGAAVVSLFVPDRVLNFSDVVLGYDNLEGYINGNSCQGAVMGRFANRIGGAAFTLGGKEYRLHKNDGDNCLHGGSVSYGKRVWAVAGIDENDNNPSVLFSYVSPDGEENFPAEVTVNVRYTLTCENSLLIEYSAVSDGDTVINLTNHAYFNLAGRGSGNVLDTELAIFADKYTPFDEFNIPTGEVAAVDKTVYDFTKPMKIGEHINSGRADGYDNNYILGEPGVMRKAAVAFHGGSGIEMTVFTDMPAVQFYTAQHLSEFGKGGAEYRKWGGFCLETQFTPNTPNLSDFPAFPPCVLRKGGEFKTSTEYVFTVKTGA